MRKTFGVEAKLLPGGKGIFDVIVDDELIFSKFETGRFPDPGEVVSRVKQ